MTDADDAMKSACALFDDAVDDTRHSPFYINPDDPTLPVAWLTPDNHPINRYEAMTYPPGILRPLYLKP